MSKTKLTQQDLKIYPSQRLTDTPDGGGLMVGTPLTGADNELFSPVSDLDRTMGAFDARLVYPGVLRNDTEPLYGAHFVITEPPKSDNVSYLAFAANGYGDSRQAIMQRIEAYSTPTIESPITLLGTQMRGSRLIQGYQNPGTRVPLVGERYCLRYVEDGVTLYEFFRVASIQHELRTFEDERGEFVRRVVKMVTQDVLKRDFEGLVYPSRLYASAPVRVLETQVADSAKYYGVRPLAAPLVKQSSNLRVDAIYEKLVPTSTVETAHVDAMAGGWPIWIETAPRRPLAQSINSVQTLHLPCSVLPGSIQMDDWSDNAQGQLLRGSAALSVDYANGTISAASGQFSCSSLSAVPAALYANYCYSSVIKVDETNQGTEWVPLLRPKPARGSVRVGYRAAAQWYWLVDFGDFVLRDERGDARGQITKAGSCTISLPVLPDVGSKIIVSWAPADFYKAFDGGEAGAAINPVAVEPLLRLPESPKPKLKPGSVQLQWQDGSGKTATDNGQGALTGHCTGVVDYAAGQIYPQGLNGAEITLSAKQYSAVAEQKAVAVADGGSVMSLVVGTCQPGSVAIQMLLERKQVNGYEVTYPVPSSATAFAAAGGHTVNGGGGSLKPSYIEVKRNPSQMSYYRGG